MKKLEKNGNGIAPKGEEKGKPSQRELDKLKGLTPSDIAGEIKRGNKELISLLNAKGRKTPLDYAKESDDLKSKTDPPKASEKGVAKFSVLREGEVIDTFSLEEGETKEVDGVNITLGKVTVESKDENSANGEGESVSYSLPPITIVDPMVDINYPTECGCSYGGGGPIKPKDESEKAELDAIYDENGVADICDAYEYRSIVTAETGSSEGVGGIEVRYKGIDKEGKAVYDIISNEDVLRSDVKAAVGEEVTIEISEHCLRVGIAVMAANEKSAVAEITVDAY